MSNITVDSTAALNSALASAHGGDTILLRAGAYTGLDYSFNNLNFASGITITSADPAHQATLTHFDIQNSSGITFSGLEMVTGATGYFQFQVFNSSNIHFDHVNVHGSMDGNAQNDIEGIRFQDSSNVSITNSEFQQLERAMAVGSTNNIVIANNNVHDIEVTGVSLAQVGNVQISGNTFSNFDPVVGSDHPDAIQFLTNGTTASSHDISITDNVIYRGAGGATQGIFLRDQVGTLPFQKVTIANNLIDGTGYGGIAVGNAQGIAVTGNVLVSLSGPGDTTPLQVFDSTGVTLTNNHATNYGTDGDTTLTMSGNITTTAVIDGGLAALNAWIAAHPEAATAANLALAGLAAPPPVVAGVNHAPSGADATTALAWNATKVFASADFGFSDTDGNHLSAVKIDSLPGVGTLTDNGAVVTAGQVVSVADIAGGKLVYQAPSAQTAAHVDLTFQVQDDGGTANGGVNLDPTANTLHFDIAALQVAPSTSPPPPPTSPPPPPPPGTGGQTTAGQHLTASAGQTQITGGAGDDTLTGGQVVDYLHGGAGNDIINGGSSFDDINGNQGNDTIDGGSGGNDWLVGGQGNDLITAHNGDNLIYGNLGNDTLIGGSGNDVMRGGQGDDSIVGGSGNDFISGDRGNDTMSGGAGADIFHSSQDCGVDKVLDFHLSEGDRVQLDPGTTYTLSQVGSDTIIDMGAGNEMILVGVQLTTLTQGWIFTG